MTTPNPAVDVFMSRAKLWRAELEKLRAILLGCGLQEELKWGKPCYTSQGKNVAILQPFKAHCALLFFKGMLLQDSHGLLRSQGDNTRSAMRLEFTAVSEIRKAIISDYVKQAIAVETAGLAPAPKAKPELHLPEELTRALAGDRALAKAFAALTPGRQRAYALHIGGAKQSRTRAARVEKCLPLISGGLGLNEGKARG